MLFVTLLLFSTTSGASALQARSGDVACSDLKNHGSYFTVELAVGSEEKNKLDVVVDTGSDELVVPSCACNNGGACTGRCLKEAIPSSAKKVSLEYGSGGLKAAVMSGTVTIGSMSVEMHESMLVMFDNSLDLASKFEGILALGPPHRSGTKRMVRLGDLAPNASGIHFAAGAHGIDDDDEDDDDNGYFYTKSFLEEASINSFSLCLNRGGTGALRFGDTSTATALGSIGGIHWGLGLAGVSVGSSTAQVATCAPGSADSGTENACGAIPDSGTTFMMAPQKQIDELYAGLCKEWPSCESADSFASQVQTCEDVTSLPSIFFHVTGTGGSATTLEIPASAYVFQQSSSCQLAFDVLEYTTEKNGPVWILGMPIFFSFQVTYDVGSDPPTMSFGSSGCRSCGGSFLRGADKANDDGGAEWRLTEPPRRSHLDVTRPL